MIDPGYDPKATDYQYIAASQTDVKIAGQDGDGKIGDLLVYVTIIPSTNTPGAVSIKDDSGGSAMEIYAGGAGGVVPNLELRSFPVDFGRGIRSTAGAWHITTGANVRALVVGRFQ
jgi:hypothetical protein